MNNLTNKELIIILAYYYFDSKKTSQNTFPSFVDKFNNTFKKDYSNQLLTYYCSLFKNVDPSYNAKPIQNNDLRIQELWEHYIVQDRVDELKKIYKNFKQGILENKIINLDTNSLDDINKYIVNEINNLHFNFFCDEIKELYTSPNTTSSSQSLRDLSVSFNALCLAKFLCEVDNNHETFIRKNIDIPYTEGHHIIPLKYQYMFKVNLDVEANIVSLCSTCHNRLHYGKDFDKILKKIFTDERKNRLKKCGIEITLEELISLYK